MTMNAASTVALRLAGRDEQGRLDAAALTDRTASCSGSMELLAIATQIDLAFALEPGGQPQLLAAAGSRLRRLAGVADTQVLLAAGWLVDLCETGAALRALQPAEGGQVPAGR